MTSHPLSSLIAAFNDIFPSKSDDFLYYYDSTNTIRCEPKDKTSPTLIFTFNRLEDWKLSTLKCANREDHRIEELRTELTTQQNKYKNLKRSFRK